MNAFTSIWNKLSEDATRLCLEAVCQREHQTLMEIEAVVQRGSMAPHLLKLQRMGLVIFDGQNGWSATRWGMGVIEAVREASG